MVESEPGALLEALAVLVPFHAGRAAPALRRALAELIDGQAGAGTGGNRTVAPDTTTPPTQGDATDGAATLAATREHLPLAATPRPASPANRAGPVLSPAPRQVASSTKDMRDWLALRQQVKAEQLRRMLGLVELAAALGLAPTTVQAAIGRRSPPSSSIRAKLHAFVAGPGAAQEATQPADGQDGTGTPPDPPEAAPGPANGDAAAPLPLAAKTVKALKRKRHAVPLTTPTLAGQLGVEVAELDAAIAGRAVSTAAAERLAAWATAG